MFLKRLSAILLCLLLLWALLPAHAEDIPYIVRNSGDQNKRIAITVDDCFDMNHFQSIVELCETYNVPVTFFVVGGAMKERDRELWQSALDAGCEIANHTQGHVSLPTKTNRQILSHLLRTQEKVDAVLGYHYPMQVMRPPYGKVMRDNGRTISSVVKKAGYQHIVLWDVSQTDPDIAIKQVKSGSILLYHTNKKDVRCLSQLIPALLDDGYTPVTISELLSLGEIATSTDLYTYDPHIFDVP